MEEREEGVQEQRRMRERLRQPTAALLQGETDGLRAKDANGSEGREWIPQFPCGGGERQKVKKVQRRQIWTYRHSEDRGRCREHRRIQRRGIHDADTRRSDTSREGAREERTSGVKRAARSPSEQQTRETEGQHGGHLGA